MAWYNKYRSQQFSEVIGQELVKSVLENALKKDKIKHGYLFSGPKGVGKTTLARIFANELNDFEHHPEAKIDLVEMDAASNTGIDDIRQLIESAKTPPVAGKYKIYIIDEVHMLSKPAMNALLKILEEPPIYLIFLLATTNPEKLLPTVLSRLTKLSLSSHTTGDIVQNLTKISELEGVNIDKPALELIAKRAGGSQRDAINLLETISSYELDKYDLENTTKLLGLLPEELLNKTAKALQTSTFSRDFLNAIETSGVDGEGFLAQLLEYLLDQSLTGSNDFNDLILPIAEILDLKLPINTTLASLALIQAKLKKKLIITETLENQNSSTIKNLEESKSLENNSIIEEKKLNSIRDIESDSKENAVSKEVESLEDNFDFENEVQQVESLVTSEKPTESNFTETAKKTQLPNESKVLEVLQQISQDSDSPPILKMLVVDINIKNISEEKLSFTVSNGIFLTQLNSAKLKSYLESKLNQKLGTIWQIENSLRAENKVLEKQASIQTNNIPQKKVEETEKSEPKTTPKKPTETKIFYSVYKDLPEIMQNSGVEVFHEPIPKPDNGDWDHHAKSMFEFEE